MPLYSYVRNVGVSTPSPGQSVTDCSGIYVGGTSRDDMQTSRVTLSFTDNMESTVITADHAPQWKAGSHNERKNQW